MATKIIISDKLRGLALTSLTAFVDGFKKQAKAFDNLSKHVHAIAKEAAAETGSDLKAAADQFDAACKAAQRQYQQEHKDADKVVPMELLCPAWAPRKSEVLRCIRKGIDPRDYDGITDMTKARIAKQEESKERGTKERDDTAEEKTETSAQIEVSPAIGKAWDRLTKAVSAASAMAALEDAIISALNDTAEDIEALYLSRGESDGETEADRQVAN